MSSITEPIQVASRAPVYPGKYARLELLDQHAAETLNQYCKTNVNLDKTATRLANLSLWQSVKSSLPLAAADFLALYLCWLASSAIVQYLLGADTLHSEGFSGLILAFVILPMAHLVGLYPGVGVSPVMEFKQLTRCSFAAFLVLAGFGWIHSPQLGALVTISALFAFVLATPVALISRFFARHVCKHFSWWGIPVFIMAEPARGLELFRRMYKTRDHGFKPAGVLLEPNAYWDWQSLYGKMEDVPTYDVRSTEEAALKHGVTWVIVSPCADRSVTPALDSSLAAIPNRVLLSSSQLDIGIWDHPYCLGSTSGLRVGGGRPSSFALAAKRLLDLTLTLGALLVGSPLVIAMCLLVKLSSRGPIFYGQRRVGYGGKEFTAWKFRTMRLNADRVLDEYLKNHPIARREWDEKHKLSNDPRVTQIGKFLRASSFDELPQLWNVLMGEMSLVGPRPIVNSPTYDACYIEQYPDEFEAYKTVRPGLTGYWQVQCRNRGVYELRIYWDMYYIRNWSIWVDLYLIMRTIKTILLREGS